MVNLVFLIFAVLVVSCGTPILDNATEQKTKPKVSLKKPVSDKKCIEGNSRACFVLGELYYKTNLYQKALNYYKIACNLNHGDGCFKAGLIDKNNNKSIVSAANYFDKACTFSSGSACFELGLIDENKQNFNQAATFYERSCRFGLALGCKKMGLLSITHFEKNQAISYFEKACTLKSGPSCFNAGIVYYKSKNFELAQSAFVRSCDMHYAPGCYNVSAILAEKKQLDASFAMLKNALNEGYNNFKLIRIDSSLAPLRQNYPVEDLLNRYE